MLFLVSAAVGVPALAPESEPPAQVARVPSALPPVAEAEAVEAEATVAVACLVSGGAIACQKSRTFGEIRSVQQHRGSFVTAARRIADRLSAVCR